MRKSILLFAFILLNIPLGVMADVNLVELVKKIQPAVATVITYDKNKKLLGQGSGFFISKDGHLITNYHVLKGAFDAEVKIFDGKNYPVKLVVAESKEADLIKLLVDIPQKDIKLLKVSKTVPEVGKRIIVVGSPMGLEQTVSEGIVSAVRDIPTLGKIFQISAPVSTGSSGSPVVDMKGEVIGVATFQFIEGQNLNFAVAGEKVLSLKSEKKGKTLDVWASGISEKKREVAKSSYTIGIKLLWTGEYEKALDYFKKALEKNKLFAEAWYWTASCYRKLGRYEKAIEAYKQAISIKPDYSDAWNDLGAIYATLNRHVEAIGAYKQAISIDPNLYFTHHNLGNTYFELKDYQKAIEAYKQAIRIKPDFAETHVGLGLTYADLGRKSEAIEAYKQAIRIKPDYAEAHCSLGIAYVELGRYEEAIGAFKQSIGIKPDYVKAHGGLGVAYDSLGRYQEGVEAYKQAVRIDPDNASAHLLLGLGYLSLGDKSSALDEYKILKTLDKDLANELFNVIYK